MRASDGSVLWHNDTNASPSVMTAGAGLVYVSLSAKNTPGVLDALDETSGAVRWQASNVNGVPVFDGTALYTLVAASSGFVAPASSNLEALSASDGTSLWTYPAANHRIELGPVIAGGVVFMGFDGQIVAISAANGAVRWRSPTLDAQAGVLGLTLVTGG